MIRKAISLLTAFSVLAATNVCAEVLPLNEIGTTDSTLSDSYNSRDRQDSSGGYIPLEWDRHVDMTDEDVSFQEALNRIKYDDDGSGLSIQASDYTPRETIPSRYPDYDYSGGDDDLKKYLTDKYPAVRAQNPYGTCWAHASVALGEFYQINHNAKTKDIDYSEAYLSHEIYNHQTNRIIGDSDEASEVAWTGTETEMLNNGGNFRYAGQFLSKGFGYINESSFPYDSVLNPKGSGIDTSRLYENDTAHLTNMYEVNIRTANGAKIVKEAIMQNGIAGISYFDDDDCYNNELSYYNGTYKDVTDESDRISNHSVSIVGWDDSYDKGNFNPHNGSSPQNNGAWLIRNSWGGNLTNFYNKTSYFWISYEDTSIENAAYIFDVDDGKPDYDYNYYYDAQIHGIADFSGECKSANIYKVHGNKNELLKEVSLEVNGDTGYSIKVYTDLSDASNPESGTIAAIENGTLSFPGIYTIRISNSLVLDKNSLFSIVVETDNRTPCFEHTFTAWKGLTLKCNRNKGQSFLYSGDIWRDLCNMDISETSGNFCISAHTIETELTSDTNVDFSKSKEEFKDESGHNVILIKDVASNTYKTEDGKYVLMISKDDGSDVKEPDYQYTSKKITPGKNSFAVYNGIVYKYKKDYTVSFKKNKNRGSATAKIKWKKKSSPYANGVKTSTISFSIIPRTVTESMVNIKLRKNGKIGKLTVTADDVTMKPKKKDYTVDINEDVYTFSFKNNFAGEVVKKI